MADWDDARGPRPSNFRQDGRRQPIDRDRRRDAPVDWNRNAARYDRERNLDRDAGAAGYARPHSRDEDIARYGRPRAVETDAYRGQEYGIESHRDESREPAQRLRRSGFDYDDPGVGQSQAGYGPSAQSHPDHEFDPDYLRWRDQQLRSHDRDYEEWRRDQHRRYDDQYRQFRAERQRQFGQDFHEWRSQRGDAGAPASSDSDRADASAAPRRRNPL